MIKRTEISVIIVHYRVKEILFTCIKSILEQTKNINFEIIVVDNDEKKHIKKDLIRKFPHVIYVPNDNKGFGQGSNVGAGYARGEYLFFLNPDTTLVNNAVVSLVSFLKNNKKAAIVAPILQDQNGDVFELQGLSTLTPLRGVFALSFINKFFPNNSISKKYWLSGWDKSKIKELDCVPGTAFMIKKRLYEKIGGFDNNFFLYFEEFDLCKRVKDLGYKLYIIPQGRVVHLWGKSTAHRNDLNEIFRESRFYYFKKHYGVFSAIMVELFTRASGPVLLKISFLLLSVLLLLYRLPSLMSFIGDQAWFYISARDLLLGESYPLVGITSSHTWLHQGALWTYILSGVLWIGNFNPVAGGYLSAAIGLLTLVMLYLIGKQLLGSRIALIASLLYATSPLVILHARMPYHTTPIPLFVLLYFFSLYQWVHGKKIYLSLSLFFLAILYNFELATVVLSAPLLLFFLYGFIKKRKWVVGITRKNILHAVLFSLIPMIPIVMYDLSHGFKQTVVYGGWLMMNALRVIGISLYPLKTPEQTINIFSFTYELLQKLVFLPHGAVAFTLLLLSTVYMLMVIYRQIVRSTVSVGLVICSLWFILTIIFYFGNKTPSEAYLPMLFPVVFLLIAFFLNSVVKKTYYLFILVSIICILNSVYLLKDNYFTSNPIGLTLRARQVMVEKIITDSNSRSFQIYGTGVGSEFESFTMPYEYLSWYLGNPTRKTNSNNVFILEERAGRVRVLNQND